MNTLFVIVNSILLIISYSEANDILGCGGFIRSHVPIDFVKVHVKLYTKQGILKEQTTCAPNNGYYFIPLYDKGDYVLQLEPPPGWSFTPTKIDLAIDGVNDFCSQGKDIDFVFKGFGITGKVESLGISNGGPSGVSVELKSDSDVRHTVTDKKGNFFFTPVYPGKYIVTISHPKWHILKNSVVVQVAEGNTELSPGSLVIEGYDVKGFIKSDQHPVEGTHIILFTENNTSIQISGCNITKFPNLKVNGKQLCHTISDDKGIFVFPVVPPGIYFVKPYYERQNIHYVPDDIKFSVRHNSVILEKPFEVMGFSISGKILRTDKKPIYGAKIFLNDSEVAVTSTDGTYKLEKIKTNTYRIKVVANDVKFDEQIVYVSPNLPSLPDIEPSAYQVCGTVLNNNPQVVEFTEINSSQVRSVLSEKGTGNFCEYLKPGKYQIKVKVSEAEKASGMQFFPLVHIIEVVASPLGRITFSQLKSTITGTVKCLQQKDCASLKVILRPSNVNEEVGLHDIVADLTESTYIFSDVRPGIYEISLTPNKFCWNEDRYKLTISSAKEIVPSFEQTGYYAIFISSHDTQCYYTTDNNSKNVIQVPKGKSTYCVPKPGKYTFLVESCHTYSVDSYLFDTELEINEIYLNAVKHQVTVGIEAAENVGSVTMTVNLGRMKLEEGPLEYKNGQYILNLHLAPSESAILVPHSNIFFFNPPILSISGSNDCINLGSVFKAVKGRVFQGKIIPPLSGVLVTVETENSEALMDETDEKGIYKFPPLDDTKEYKISAKKNSYVLVGPDEQGFFYAHKLAEIVVEVVDEVTNSPLQGTLLSLSGGESYRSNLQTGEDGKIKFHSLSPSDYFLKPMMKEYVFEPNSKIINVKEGATINVLLKGKRVAYSAFGQVSSLNGEPEEGISVVATGLGNCSHTSEEATSELNGSFRIRGLQSRCSYVVQVKGSLEPKQSIERAIPFSLNIDVSNEDISNLKFIALRPVTTTDILVKVYTENPDNYKLLRVKLLRDSLSSTLLHTIKIDTSHLKITKENNPGVLIQIPSVSMDHKIYYVQLESMSGSGTRGKIPFYSFIANTPFIYGELEFTVKAANTEQQIKQTSVWTLIVIFGMIFILYNIDVVGGLVRENLSKYDFPNFLSKYKHSNTHSDYTIDKNEIDQIVQNINAPKKKPKPRKI